MADHVDAQTRSRIMQRIRSKDTKPELAVRSFLHRAGFRFRLHVRGLPGTPDLVLSKYRAAFSVHGYFWHQHPCCKHSGIPLSRREYWEPKLRRTIARDRRHRAALRRAGWRALVLWECRVTENRLRRLARDLGAGA
jgi:DNA mismatch endonuclease (patch repair protein)